MPLQTGSATANSEYDAVLKDFYEGPVREHIENKVTILRLTEKSKRMWTGRQVRWPVHLSRNEGVGARGENANLPTAGEQGYVESNIRAKFLYGRIELTGPVMAASRGDKGAFASALKQEVSGMRRDLRNDLNRQVWGVPILSGSDAGKTGVLARVATSNAANPNVTLLAVNDSFSDAPGTRYLKKNMLVAIGTPTELEGTTSVSGTIGNVVSRTVISMSAAVTIVTDDFVVRGTSTENSFDNEITGLSYIVHDSEDVDLQTIDTSTNTEFKAHRETNAVDRDLSLELMQVAIDAADEKGGEEPTLIMGHQSMRREYINLLTSDVRYAPEQLKGGFQTLTYAGGMQPIQVQFDKHAPYGKLYFIHLPDIKQYVMKDWGWADDDGAVLSRKTDKDSWEAFMCWYGNLGVERRNTHAVIENLNHSNLIF